MVSESVKAELDKLDKLQKEFEHAMEVYQAHVRANRFDLLREDDKAWKAAEKAWQEQIKKVYPNCIFGHDKIAETAAHENRDQLQNELGMLADEFRSELELDEFRRELEGLEEPDDLADDFTAAEIQWHQITDENRMKENLELLAREHFEEGTSTRFEGDYIASIYRYGKLVIGFPADAYEIDSDIPIKEMIELRVKPTWSSCFRKETILTGESVILVDAKTQEIVFRLNSNEEIFLVDSFGQTASNAGRACFMDGVRCQFASPVSVEEYRGMMCLEYATMYSQEKMPDEVYWHTLHEITTLYVLGCVSQYGYAFLKKQSQKLRDKAREEWESMATSKRCEAMQIPLTEEEKWIR